MPNQVLFDFDGAWRTTAETVLNWHVWSASLDTAKTIAKGNRHSGNYMVCIEENGERIIRWDRDKIGGENRWRKVDTDAFEMLGIVREVVRPR